MKMTLEEQVIEACAGVRAFWGGKWEWFAHDGRVFARMESDDGMTARVMLTGRDDVLVTTSAQGGSVASCQAFCALRSSAIKMTLMVCRGATGDMDETLRNAGVRNG